MAWTIQHTCACNKVTAVCLEGVENLPVANTSITYVCPQCNRFISFEMTDNDIVRQEYLNPWICPEGSVVGKRAQGDVGLKRQPRIF